jgi:hypothetical protein
MGTCLALGEPGADLIEEAAALLDRVVMHALEESTHCLRPSAFAKEWWTQGLSAVNAARVQARCWAREAARTLGEDSMEAEMEWIEAAQLGRQFKRAVKYAKRNWANNFLRNITPDTLWQAA